MVERSADLELERRALSILEQVLEVEPEARAQILETTCADDARLHLRVTTLLGLEELGELAQPAGMPCLADLVPEMCDEAVPGGRIGAYELARPIARGGMGWVYEAIQDQPKRRVALKILRRGFSSDVARRRFQLESEVLAYLKHPGIAQVYEAGVHVEQGVLGAHPMPFLALEFVDQARSITAYAREQALDQTQKLELFLEACDAVLYGHSKGVIHRDLKPANILVSAAGKVKVIDFGIARVVTQELDTTLDFTRTGQLLGTLGSMSPEQFGSDPTEVDVRSDVYSLGVVLYQMLAGRRPFDLEGKSVAEVAEVVRAGSPIPPRRLVPALALDLEAILLKALQSQRELRYGTVLSLMEDLERFLRREPVLARAPGWLQRGRLFVRRNPLPVTMLVALILVLSAATGVSLNRVLVAESATDAMHEALEQAKQAGASEHEALAKAEAAVQAKLLALRHEKNLKTDLLTFQETVILRVNQRLAAWGLPLSKRAEILELSIATFHDMTPSSRQDPTVQAALGDLYLRLGDIEGNPNMDNLGDEAQALEAYAAARAIGEELIGYPEDSSARLYGRYLLALLATRGASLMQLGGGNELARAAFVEARESFAALHREYPRDERFALGLADVSASLGNCAAALGEDPAFLEECFRQGIELIEGLGELASSDPECMDFLNNNYNQLATILGHNGRAPEAIEILNAALRRSQARLRQNKDSADSMAVLANTHIMLADVYRVTKEYKQADGHAEEACELLFGLLDEPESLVRNQTALALANSVRGSIHIDWADQFKLAGEDHEQNLRQAEENLEEALLLIEGLLQSKSSDQVLDVLHATVNQNLKRVRARQ